MSVIRKDTVPAAINVQIWLKPLINHRPPISKWRVHCQPRWTPEKQTKVRYRDYQRDISPNSARFGQLYLHCFGNCLEGNRQTGEQPIIISSLQRIGWSTPVSSNLKYSSKERQNEAEVSSHPCEIWWRWVFNGFNGIHWNFRSISLHSICNRDRVCQARNRSRDSVVENQAQSSFQRNPWTVQPL